MIYAIGIDPSINNTGICIIKYDNNIKIDEQFIILKPYNKLKSPDKQLVKKEKNAQDTLNNFKYIFYESENLNIYDDLLNYKEYWKSYNMISCANKIKEIIQEYTNDNPDIITICIEGISYGSSIRTKSIYDLAGLNYLIREKFISSIDKNTIFTISTPTSIKKFASGKGNSNKDIIINMFLVLYNQFNIIPKVDDIADAYFMAKYAYSILNEINQVIVNT